MSVDLVNLVGIDTYCNLHIFDPDTFETIPECEERDTVEVLPTISGLLSEGITTKQIKRCLDAHLAGRPNVVSIPLVRHHVHKHTDSYHPFTILVSFIITAFLGATLIGRIIRYQE